MPAAKSGTRDVLHVPARPGAPLMERSRGARSATPVGFFGGVRAVFGGLGFVMTTPSVWGWAMIPMIVAAALFGFACVGAVAGGSALAQRIIGDAPSGTWSSVGTWALELLFWTVGIVLAFVISMTLAQPLSGFALDRVARKQELALGGRVWPDAPLLAGALRSLRVSLGALAMGLPVLGLLALVTFLFPPAGVVTVPLKFVVTGVLAAYDLLDYPLSHRGYDVRDRLVFMRENARGVVGFGVAVAALLLIPGVGLILLPFGVAGAAQMVFRSGVDGGERER